MKLLPPRGQAALILAAFEAWPKAQCLNNFLMLLNILQAPRPYKFSTAFDLPNFHEELSLGQNLQLEVGHRAAYGDLKETIPANLRPLLELIPDLKQNAGAAPPEILHLLAIIIAFWRPGDFIFLEMPQFNLPSQALPRLLDFLAKKEFHQQVIIHGPRSLWEERCDYYFWPEEGRIQFASKAEHPAPIGRLEFNNIPKTDLEI